MRGLALLAVPVLALACARPPAALRGTFAPVGVQDAQQRDGAGERVRWGGEIVETRPGANETCFEVVSRPLDRQARPRDADETAGRFIACAPGFSEPSVYAPGRELTVAGGLASPTTRKVGDYDYRFPLVRAETVYLWPKREVPPAYHYDPWYDPYWGPHPYGRRGGLVTVPLPRSRRPAP